MGSTQGVNASSSPANRNAPATFNRLPEASTAAMPSASASAGTVGPVAAAGGGGRALAVYRPSRFRSVVWGG